MQQVAIKHHNVAVLLVSEVDENSKSCTSLLLLGFLVFIVSDFYCFFPSCQCVLAGGGIGRDWPAVLSHTICHHADDAMYHICKGNKCD